MKNDTPRTDAFLFSNTDKGRFEPKTYADFMRMLERELAEMKYAKDNVAKVTEEALRKRNESEKDRDAARESRDCAAEAVAYWQKQYKEQTDRYDQTLFYAQRLESLLKSSLPFLEEHQDVSTGQSEFLLNLVRQIAALSQVVMPQHP